MYKTIENIFIWCLLILWVSIWIMLSIALPTEQFKQEAIYFIVPNFIILVGAFLYFKQKITL